MAKHYIEYPVASVDELLEKLVFKRRHGMSTSMFTMDNIPMSVLQESSFRLAHFHDFWHGNQSIILLQMELARDPQHPSGVGMPTDKMREFNKRLNECGVQINYCEQALNIVQRKLLLGRPRMFTPRSGHITGNMEKRNHDS